mmetsp:Transcript_94943/g.307052  ORF Transcript_94943/g.307052 Transcript_94943/m.307052 type:complete len:701 (+) Transcript_94943:3397-5499(+)
MPELLSCVEDVQMPLGEQHLQECVPIAPNEGQYRALASVVQLREEAVAVTDVPAVTVMSSDPHVPLSHDELQQCTVVSANQGEHRALPPVVQLLQEVLASRVGPEPRLLKQLRAQVHPRVEHLGPQHAHASFLSMPIGEVASPSVHRTHQFLASDVRHLATPLDHVVLSVGATAPQDVEGMPPIHEDEVHQGLRTAPHQRHDRPARHPSDMVAVGPSSETPADEQPVQAVMLMPTRERMTSSVHGRAQPFVLGQQAAAQRARAGLAPLREHAGHHTVGLALDPAQHLHLDNGMAPRSGMCCFAEAGPSRQDESHNTCRLSSMDASQVLLGPQPHHKSLIPSVEHGPHQAFPISLSPSQDLHLHRSKRSFSGTLHIAQREPFVHQQCQGSGLPSSEGHRQRLLRRPDPAPLLRLQRRQALYRLPPRDRRRLPPRAQRPGEQDSRGAGGQRHDSPQASVSSLVPPPPIREGLGHSGAGPSACIPPSRHELSLHQPSLPRHLAQLVLGERRPLLRAPACRRAGLERRCRLDLKGAQALVELHSEHHLALQHLHLPPQAALRHRALEARQPPAQQQPCFPLRAKLLHPRRSRGGVPPPPVPHLLLSREGGEPLLKLRDEGVLGNEQALQFRNVLEVRGADLDRFDQRSLHRDAAPPQRAPGREGILHQPGVLQAAKVRLPPPQAQFQLRLRHVGRRWAAQHAPR